MIIDFHTHCFPDSLAERAIGKLASNSGIPNVTDGTASGTLALMDASGVDVSVVCNIATNPKQQHNVNSFAIELAANPRFRPLGSLNPQSAPGEQRAELERLRANGINGIKLHPDYMGEYIDGEGFDKIFRLCVEYDMFVVTHAGWDPLSPDDIHAPPERIARVLDRYPGLRLSAAHFGGYNCWDAVERLLCGREVWIDLSLLALGALGHEQARRIILSHSPDRLLFASDAPWCSPAKELDALRALGLPGELMEKLLYKNALALLGE